MNVLSILAGILILLGLLAFNFKVAIFASLSMVLGAIYSI